MLSFDFDLYRDEDTEQYSTVLMVEYDHHLRSKINGILKGPGWWFPNLP